MKDQLSKTMDFKTIDMEQLVVQCQTGDKQALKELVIRNQKIVYSVLYNLLADKTNISDLAQEVLLRMCKSIQKLRNPSTFKWWLNQIITNLVYDELRKKKRKLYTVSIDETMKFDGEENTNINREISDTSQLPDESAINSELNERIRKAIKNLPEQFKEVIVYRELQGLSYEEIANLTGTNIGTVKSRIARARSRLQEELKPYINAG